MSTVYDKCCYPGEHCCPGGCVPPDAIGCCGSLYYCLAGEKCCEGMGCIPTTGNCCSDGNYCPSPFNCVKLYSSGRIVCCIDTDCTVYLDINGNTVTLTSDSPSTTYTTPRATTTPAVTTRRASTTAYTEYEYQTYYTTIYW